VQELDKQRSIGEDAFKDDESFISKHKSKISKGESMMKEGQPP